MAKKIKTQEKESLVRTNWDYRQDEKMTRVFGLGTPPKDLFFCEWVQRYNKKLADN